MKTINMNGEKKVYTLLAVVVAIAIIISAGNICYRIITILSLAR